LYLNKKIYLYIHFICLIRATELLIWSHLRSGSLLYVSCFLLLQHTTVNEMFHSAGVLRFNNRIRVFRCPGCKVFLLLFNGNEYRRL